MSNQAQPHEHSERSQSEIREAVLRALNTLPEDESRAIHERLGLGMKQNCAFHLLCNLSCSSYALNDTYVTAPHHVIRFLT
jgi:hypothetical protein